MAFVERPPASQPPGEYVPKAWQVGFLELDSEEARKACIGENYKKFDALFEDFDEHDGFRLSFLWGPFLLGFFWFLYRKMYFEAILFFVLSFVINVLFALLVPDFAFSGLVATLLSNLPGALAGGWIYYKKSEEKIEKALSIFSENPAKVIGWLRWQGGCHSWVIAIIILYLLLILYVEVLTVLGGAIALGIRGV